jgi:predicted membrane chloride channel (bestrophin family)
MNKDLVHTKNEWLYTVVRKDYVASQVSHVTVGERKQKLVQFYVCFHLLSKGRPMTNYDNMSKLLQFLDVKNYPRMYWYNNTGYEIATYMHEVVVNKTLNLVQNVQFISLSYDEVTTCEQ